MRTILSAAKQQSKGDYAQTTKNRLSIISAQTVGVKSPAVHVVNSTNPSVLHGYIYLLRSV